MNGTGPVSKQASDYHGSGPVSKQASDYHGTGPVSKQASDYHGSGPVSNQASDYHGSGSISNHTSDYPLWYLQTCLIAALHFISQYTCTYINSLIITTQILILRIY